MPGTAAGNANGSTQRTPQASAVVETIATAGPSLLRFAFFSVQFISDHKRNQAAKLSDLNPEAYLRYILERIADQAELVPNFVFAVRSVGQSPQNGRTDFFSDGGLGGRRRHVRVWLPISMRRIPTICTMSPD